MSEQPTIDKETVLRLLRPRSVIIRQTTEIGDSVISRLITTRLKIFYFVYG